MQERIDIVNKSLAHIISVDDKETEEEREREETVEVKQEPKEEQEGEVIPKEFQVCILSLLMLLLICFSPSIYLLLSLLFLFYLIINDFSQVVDEREGENKEQYTRKARLFSGFKFFINREVGDRRDR